LGLFAKAQKNIIFGHITSEQGLSQNDVNSICQDNEGFLWIATHDGLNKYDGYSFKTFRPNPEETNSIPSSLVEHVYKDNEGYIWIVNTNQGISRLDPTTEKFLNFPYQKTNKQGLITIQINKTFVDAQKQLWVGTQKGINILDTRKLPGNKTFSHIYINEDDVESHENHINDIFQDDDENIWIATGSGLYRAFKNSKGILSIINVTEETGLPPKVFVNKIVCNKNKDLFFSTRKGLYRKKKNESKVALIVKIPFAKLTFDENNNLWGGGTDGLTLLKYNSEKDTYSYKENFRNNIKIPSSLNRTGIRCLFIDDSNILWAGTKGGGLNKMNPKGNHFRTIRSDFNKNSLSYNNIRSIFKDSNGRLWVGTEDGSLNLSLPKQQDQPFKEFKSFINTRNVFSISEIDHFGNKYLLFGSETSNLLRTSVKKSIYKNEDFKKVKDSPNAIFAITQTKDKNIWLGSFFHGLFKWIPKKNGHYLKHQFNTTKNNVSSNTIRDLLEDSDGNLWIATSKGLNFLSKKELSKAKPNFQIFRNDINNKKSISHDYILAVHQGHNGTIWVGTFGGGLNKFIPATPEKPAYFKTYSEKNGLPNNIIKAIEEDDSGNLWISSNKGLSRFNPKTENFRNYDVYDGLQGNEFMELASFNCDNGKMLFGGINGINSFFPAQILDNTKEAKPLFTNLMFPNKKILVRSKYSNRVLLKKSLNNTKTITLKPDENSFAIEFASSHTASPNKNKFKYKLEGFDTHWIHTNADDRYAKYTNLRSGNYTFKLRASNNDGIWSSEEKTLEIKITPHFLKSTWAYIVYGLAIVGLLFAFRKYTIIRVQEKHQFDVQKLEKEKSEELQQMKLEFFTNISHEFRTPLTLIKGPLDYLEKKDAEIDTVERQKQYGLMKKNANYLLRLVNQLLDFRRLDREKMKLNFINLNIVDFIEETTGPFLFMANKKKIDFSIKAIDKNIILPIDADAMEKILNNLLFNAFKFTPKNHSITIEIHKGENFKNTTIFNKTLNLSEYIIIQVKDTGKGIEPENLEHVFERYYVEKKQNIQGAGIGLSFTKSLVELHEGIISVQSEVEKETTFSILLPTYREDLKQGKIIELEHELAEEKEFSNLAPDLKTLTGELKADLEKSKTGITSHELPKLLIIEDNEDIRTFIKQGVADQYQIMEANNGKEGLELAMSEIPNLILSDIMMPIMDGLTMSKKLKGDEKTSHIPIILLTAKSSTDTEREALGIGIDDFIRKPFELDILALKINNIMTKRASLRDKYQKTVSLEPSEIVVTSVDEKFLKKAMSIVEDHMMNTEFSVEMLVTEMGMSRSNLYLKLKEITGLSSSEFIRSVRLKRAVQLIKKSDLSVKEIMYMTGFNTASYFSKCFKKQYGIVPSEYVKSLKKEKESLSNLSDD